MHDYYQILGVAREASPQVVKFAFEGKMRALADPAYAASPEEKREEERLLREAFVTLSVAAKRAPYDTKLAAFENESPARTSERPAWFAPAVVAGFMAIAASALWVNHSRDRERIRLEEERIAMEKENAARNAELEAQRLRDFEARQAASIELARSRNEQLRLQRERADDERRRVAEERQVRQGEAARLSQERRAQQEAQREDDLQRRAEEQRRRQAQFEVDRQKEYLRRLELDEERVRAARHAQAQREAQERQYRQYLEERRARLQQER